MKFRTIVDIEKPGFEIEPLEPLLFVGSCFADSIGKRFIEERFPATVNPFGVMYNPASVLHTIQQWLEERPGQWSMVNGQRSMVNGQRSMVNGQRSMVNGQRSIPRIVFLTLGTNHVYRLRETDEIVDNCQKRPQRLFQEEELTVEQCVDYLSQAVVELSRRNADVQVIVTVSPIRYAKYGFHGSQLSKATLLMAADELTRRFDNVTYFPAYELALDELRDYRFYQQDMLHPSAQAVEYIWERLVETYFSPRAKKFLDEWQPIKQALAHRPFNPDSPEYQEFLEETRRKEQALLRAFNS